MGQGDDTEDELALLRAEVDELKRTVERLVIFAQSCLAGAALLAGKEGIQID